MTQQAISQLGLLTSPTTAASHPIPDLATIASQTVLWEAFMPAAGTAAAGPGSEQQLLGQEQQQQELQERAWQLFISAGQVRLGCVSWGTMQRKKGLVEQQGCVRQKNMSRGPVRG